MKPSCVSPDIWGTWTKTNEGQCINNKANITYTRTCNEDKLCTNSDGELVKTETEVKAEDCQSNNTIKSVLNLKNLT